MKNMNKLATRGRHRGVAKEQECDCGPMTFLRLNNY